ncbi:MAG TPA: transglutaminase-like domain-containing protein [Rhizomicrobium sp.]|nr:transglutaminase-like domain-containing protein [Rhizomicrobium sp.]
MTQDPADYLHRLGETGDGPHDIARAALMFAALDHSGRQLSSYEDHLQEIANHAREDTRLMLHMEDGARALAFVMVGRYGYDGDRFSYDDPSNADLISVIERRRGLPVAIGILYLHAARAAGFEAVGLNSPGHFLIRLTFRGHAALIDPFNGAQIIREGLALPPRTGTGSLDDPRLSTPVSDIEVLLRLQNNLKLRAINAGEKQRAVEIGTRMLMIAPKRADLWLDIARLNEASGALGAAQKAYESCMSLAMPKDGLHNEAALGLHALKRRLN